jgi:hypothetical protein
MKIEQAPPGAKRLIESLKNLGYDCATAIADLIDNSLAAEASEVVVDIEPREGNIPAHIIISDNGNGMDREALLEAMRYGAHQEYQEDDLGKFGLGLKTASSSQCRALTVLSRANKTAGASRKAIMRWDLEHVAKTDGWEVHVLDNGDLKPWEIKAFESPVSARSGTTVLWSSLEDTLSGLSVQTPERRERHLAALIDEVELHLRMVFHRFLQGLVPGRKRLSLTLCSKQIEPWDPFCAREKERRELTPLRFSVGKHFPEATEKRGQVIVHPFIMPREDQFSNKDAHKDAAGPKGWNAQQGFYYYRNNRLLQSGGWSNLRAPDEHTKLLRIAVDFPSSLDNSFSLNITKMKAHFPSEIREEVKANVSRWINEARKVYDRGPKRRSRKSSPDAPETEIPDRPSIKLGGVSFSLGVTPSKQLSVIGDRKTGELRVTVPFKHNGARLFDKVSGLKGNLKRACTALIIVLEAVQSGRIRPEEIPVDAIRRSMRRFL